MRDKTEAQKWKQRLKDDCEVVGEPRNASHDDTLYFDHLHDLADCGYDRAEEVAASLAELSERVDALERMRNPQELMKPISVLGNRVDVMQRELAPHVADLRRHERSAPAPVTITRDELNRVMGYPKSGHWIDYSSIVIPVLAHFGIKVLPESRAYTVGYGVERGEP